MATFNFTVPIYGFDQWTGASTNNTVGYPVGTTFSLNAGAALTVINVEDDDGTASQLCSDGDIDTPWDRVATPAHEFRHYLLPVYHRGLGL